MVSIETLETLGERLRYARREATGAKGKRLTQQELGDIVGLKGGTIASFEVGNGAPSDRTIKDLCAALNLNETWLRTGEGDMYQPYDRAAEMAALVGRILQDEPSSLRYQVLSLVLSIPDEAWPIITEFLEKYKAGWEPGED